MRASINDVNGNFNHLTVFVACFAPCVALLHRWRTCYNVPFQSFVQKSEETESAQGGNRSAEQQVSNKDLKQLTCTIAQSVKVVLLQKGPGLTPDKKRTHTLRPGSRGPPLKGVGVQNMLGGYFPISSAGPVLVLGRKKWSKGPLPESHSCLQSCAFTNGEYSAYSIPGSLQGRLEEGFLTEGSNLLFVYIRPLSCWLLTPSLRPFESVAGAIPKPPRSS